MKDYKILALSDSILLPTGYANQSREILTRLAKEPEFEVKTIGAQYAGMPMHVNFDEGIIDANPRDSPKLLANGNQPYGADILQYYVRNEKPDLTWILLDTFMVYYLNNQELKPSKFIMYFPSDGDPLPLGSENILRKATLSVAMSKYAQAQAIDAGINAAYIPHATNPQKFYPFTTELKAENRVKWSQKLNFPLNDKFIVGYVGRNQGRKMADRLMVAFAKFAKQTKNAVLLMHTDPYDMAAVMSLIELARRYDVADRVLFTGATLNICYSERDLLEIYNLCDVFASSTSGEGFGIPFIESMACEVPVVTTDYTTCKEIITDNNAGLGCKIGAFITGTYNVDRAIVDVNDMAANLKYLYDNPAEIIRMGKNGRQAVLREYDWKNVYPVWKKTITEVLEK